MRQTMRCAALLLCLCLVLGTGAAALPAPPEITAPSAVLFSSDGTMLYQKNAHEPLQPASVTKIMTMLLIMEAIDEGRLAWDEMVTASAYAASMGGTQIFLQEGEQMTVEDMFKSIVVASANDAAVAMAEHLGGSEEGFVQMMNERAAELGMEDSHFINANGLDGDGEKTLTSAYDLALASCELLKHETVKNYTSIWMDTVRNGQFGLANTNKMLKRYEGMTGLKTGYISQAGYCISASAERDGLELVAVIMAADTKENRMADATALLNYGFANYQKIAPEVEGQIPPVPVRLGQSDSVQGVLGGDGALLLEKDQVGTIQQRIEMEEELRAPVEQGQTIGRLTLESEGEVLLTVPIVAQQRVEALTLGQIYQSLWHGLLMR